ncbi:ABC transporter permease [Catenulispora subtropica]|uniref:Oligopeptide transport system permease protein OppC n=1 Tax=Catenulispora subtropica TaxID=450798 RepID=A0ABP5CVT3_9ACTN
MAAPETDFVVAEEDTAIPPAEPVALSRGRIVLRRFRRRRLAVAGLVILLFMFALAFIGPHLNSWGYKDKDYENFLTGPSATHWFGTTQIGSDVYAQTLRGLQKSLVIGLLAAVLSTGVAGVVGATAGYFGGWADRVLMWCVDLLLVLPSFLILAITSPLFHGRTWLLFVILLAAFNWMVTARMVRGLARSLREREFVTAAEVMGVHPLRIITRHLLPNMASLLIIDATLNVGGTIIAETSLSYFGFGVQPPDVSLGTIIADGTDSAMSFPWLFYPAGLMLILTVMAVAFIGDGLRDAMDDAAGTASGSGAGAGS